jgi:hypothetical protein
MPNADPPSLLGSADDPVAIACAFLRAFLPALRCLSFLLCSPAHHLATLQTVIGSPPALTLAQITTVSAKGNSGFERLISRTICEYVSSCAQLLLLPPRLSVHLLAVCIATDSRAPTQTTVVSYVILAAPTTVLLVLGALLVAENDHA